MKPLTQIILASFLLAAVAGRAAAPLPAGKEKATAAELAKQLQNPIASLISVPIQNNWDFGIGPANAMRYMANIQPVIPFSISTDWNVITRTIMPVIYAESPVTGGPDKEWLGDILQSFFFSPKQPVGGWIMGAGPVFLYPSATDDALGGEKWGAGPTAVVLQQKQGWMEFKLVFGAAAVSDQELAVVTRSLTHIMAFFSSQVEVPAEHIAQGRAAPGATGGALRIACTKNRPTDAFVVVPYRGRWFWIDDCDLKTKRAFAFMMTLFTLADTGERENLPILTIPTQ